MKRLSRTRIPRALGPAPRLPVLLLTNLRFRLLPLRSRQHDLFRPTLFPPESRVPCTTAQPGHTSKPLLPTIQFA
jgi:hypothetical protein